MAPAEIPFEYLLAAIETTRGTAIATPTRNVAAPGTLIPKGEVYFPPEARGTLVEYYRSQSVRRWVEFETDDTDLDLNAMQFWLAMAVKGGVSATLVEAGVYKWIYTPSVTSDDLKSATMWWGDPNMQVWRAAYCMLNEFTISADGKDTEGTKFALSGQGQKEAKVTAPAAPAYATPLSISPAYMDVWLEPNTTNAYGTTLITSRVLMVEHSIPVGMRYKFGPGGVVSPPADARTFRRTGRTKRHMTTTIELELLDTAQYDIFDALHGQPVRMRTKHWTQNLIGATQRGYLQVDHYGPLLDLEWGEYEESNRTVKFTIPSMYDSVLGADFSIELQNATNVV